MNKKDFTQLPYNELKKLCTSIYTQHGYTVDTTIEQGKEYIFLSKDNKLLFIILLLTTPRLSSIPEVVQELNQLRKLGEAYNCFNYRIISPYGFQKKTFELEQYNVILSDWKYLVDIQTNQLDFDLFPHNDIAYRKIKEGFENSNRVAVIKPTGTGKSVLISRFLYDYKKEKALVLTPSNFIIDQVNKHIDWKNDYEYITYAKTMFLSLKDVKNLQPSVIILDEFHRCGADEWGKGVEMILNEFPDAKILGTTATPIRHLDNARNMAEELFDNNVAVNLSLNGAIVQRILPTPKYVSALYTLDEEVESMTNRIKQSNAEDKEGLLNRLLQSKLDWENAKGIPKIIEKHVPKDAYKIIVFTKDVEHLQEMEQNVTEWFHKAGFKNIKSYTVHSGQNGNNQIFKEFEIAEEGYLHLLFAVDMLNEGIHVKGVDGEVMLRPTESNIIFYQQLGRCLTVSFEKQPFILDLVNNFKNVRTKEFVNDYNKAKEKAASNKHGIEDYAVSFSITDETKDITELFDSLGNSFDSWNVFIEKLTEFKKEFGHCNVPKNYEDKWLGDKVSNMRVLYKNNRFPEERIQQLEELGFVWNMLDHSWNQFIEKLTEFKKEFGHCNVPREHDYKWLAGKIHTVRSYYKKGKLSDKQIQQLEELGFVWDIIEESWNQLFTQLIKFKKEFKHVNVPSSHDNQWLVTRISSVRASYRDNKLSDEQIQQLEELGFVWNPMEIKKEESWNKFIQKLTEFKKEFGHCNVPRDYENYWLFHRVTDARTYFRIQKLTDKQIQQLEKLGFVWELKKLKTQESWNQFIEKLIEFKKEFGHCNVPSNYKEQWLASKINNIRANYRKGKLSDKQIQQLEELGFVWELKKLKTQESWNQFIEKLTEFKKEFGHCNVSYKHLNKSFFRKVSKLRERYKKGKLSEERIQQLEELGFVWSAR